MIEHLLALDTTPLNPIVRGALLVVAVALLAACLRALHVPRRR